MVQGASYFFKVSSASDLEKKDPVHGRIRVGALKSAQILSGALFCRSYLINDPSVSASDRQTVSITSKK